ncbi:hypothetical protein [Brevibacterium moorei]|uniref:hypothetical protein n=1 Tax=Brevibacterium moorei TaxID=2968457 RepID=UPI00211D0FC8|nr:hypothetical protein [Brevibacterium sp. 68QC2CO]MCQ9385152.1 hypothetical protein [Brevibacterium sp. 68QC2CO]
MKFRKSFGVLLAGLAAAGVALTGCYPKANGQESRNTMFKVSTIRDSDGTEYACVRADSGGVDCNWDNPKGLGR